MDNPTKLMRTTIARRTAQDETVRCPGLALADELDRVTYLQDTIQALTTIEQSIQQNAGTDPARKANDDQTPQNTVGR